MERTYAVVWEDGGDQPYAGCLSLGRRQLHLDGATTGVRLGYDEIASVHMARTARERIRGRRAVVVERRHGRPIRIACVAGAAGELGEVADRLQRLVPS